MKSNTQSISLEELEKVSFGDPAFKKELVEIFIGQIPEFVSNMEDFYNNGDFKNLAKEAHTAKSSAMIFGMTGTGISLKEIQLQAEQNITGNLPALLEKVVKELNDAAIELKNLLKNL